MDLTLEALLLPMDVPERITRQAIVRYQNWEVVDNGMAKLYLYNYFFVNISIYYKRNKLKPDWIQWYIEYVTVFLIC